MSCPCRSNLDHAKRREKLILWRRYTPEEYPKYDNYDAINVNRTAEIPMDYDGTMGVPISFLDKHNPDQFEIIGMDRPTGHRDHGKTKPIQGGWQRTVCSHRHPQ